MQSLSQMDCVSHGIYWSIPAIAKLCPMIFVLAFITSGAPRKSSRSFDTLLRQTICADQLRRCSR